jgi:hypothetical protein
MLAALNPHIEPAYWWLTAITVPLWALAVFWNVAAARCGVAEGVRLRAATAALALVYMAANITLLFSTVNPARWSDLLRGVSIAALPVVWIQPARLSVRMARKIREADARLHGRHGVE